MSQPSSPSVTELLNRWCQGDEQAAEQAFSALYPELKKIARRALGRGRAPDALATTELVHEAFLRLEAQRDVAWQNREQLLAIASMMMRRAVVDDVRFRGRARRGGGVAPAELDSGIAARDPISDSFVLADAIEHLRKAYPRAAAVVTMRYFGGMTMPEIAAALDLSLSTVEGDRRLAMAWLRRHFAA